MSIPTTAHADCLIYQMPVEAICDMDWTLDSDFWVGVYSVRNHGGEVGDGQFTMGMAPEDMGEATIAQIGADLNIIHPQRVLDAQLSSYGGSEDWSQIDAIGTRILPLFDLEQVAGCTNLDMPRWRALTHTEDGYPLTLDLLAVGPKQIYGYLHAEDGNRYWRAYLTFTRSDFPIEAAQEVVLPSGQCESRCNASHVTCEP